MNSNVCMSYAKCSRKALQVIDKIPSRTSECKTPNLVYPFEHFAQNDVIRASTSKISSSIKQKRPRKAINLFKEMLINEQTPNFVTLLSVLKAAGMAGSRHVVLGVHGYSIKVGILESQAPVVTALAGLYSHWDMASAWKLYAEAPHRDVVLCTSMITSCLEKMDYAEAFKLLKEMVFSSMQPNHVTIATVLASCADISALQHGKEIRCYSIRRALCHHHMIVSNSLMDMYSKCRCLNSALHVFEHMQAKDTVSCRIIIRGSVISERPRKALEIFHKMRVSSAVVVDNYILQELLRACSQLYENNFMVQGFHGLIWKTGHIAFAPLATELLQAYSQCGDVKSARSVFDQLHNKDVVVWSVMVSSYAQNSEPQDAFCMFREMQLAGCRPNQYTFLSLLLLCSEIEAVEIGESLHSLMTKFGYSESAYLTSALIDMYCHFGKTAEGKAVFSENMHRDFICWSSMINGFGINGCGEEALECFSNMLSSGIEPNDIVFLSILSACSHCGLDYEGWNWFHAMETLHGITPKLEHYACMVDILTRQGNLEEALEFVKRMPMEPDKRIWGALLAGCRIAHPPPDFLNLVAEKLLPDDSSYFVGLSNLFADQGRWEEVEELRNIMDSKSLKKSAGYSAI